MHTSILALLYAYTFAFIHKKYRESHMKKTVIFILICLLYSAQTFAQENSSKVQYKENKFDINYWGGVTISKLTSKSAFPTFGPYDNRKVGLTFGSTVEVYFRTVISVETGLFYSQLGGSSNKQTGTDENGNELGGFYFTNVE